jgi:hypothetical protein
MMRWPLLSLAFLSPFFFPWPLTALLALIAASITPLAPLAIGLSLDALYYVRGVSALPWWTFYGLIATLLAYGVRRFLETSIMQW